MNVSFEKTDDLNGVLSISIEKTDYDPKVEEQIKAYRKKAQIPGFRPGTAPVAMIKKMYGKSFIADEVNKLAQDTLNGYLKDNKLDIIGQPILSNSKESNVDFEKSETFTLHFDLGLAPEFDFNISDKDSVTRYVIEVDDKEVETEINNLCRQHGVLEKVEECTEESDSILVILTELDDNNNPLEGGVEEKETTVIPELVRDEKTKNLFMNKKIGEKVIVSLHNLFNDNHTMMASATGIPKELIRDLNTDFEAEIKNIQKFTPSELNQSLFDKVFGENVVTDEESFKTKVKENAEVYYASESENQLEHTMDHVLADKHHFELPDAFIKRWLLESHAEAYNTDNVDEKYETEANGLRYQLIQEKTISLFNLEITDEEIDNTAIGYSANLLRNYGIQNPEFAWVKEFAEKQKAEPKFMQKVRDIAIQRSVINKLKDIVTIVEQKISVQGFYDMIKEHNHVHSH